MDEDVIYATDSRKSYVKEADKGFNVASDKLDVIIGPIEELLNAVECADKLALYADLITINHNNNNREIIENLTRILRKQYLSQDIY
jgi:hypothetical protein